MYDILAKRIPDKVRSERLMIKEDPIANVQPVSSNKHMQLLFDVYTQFVFPGKEEDRNCWRCMNRIIQCFDLMKPHLVAIEKNYKLLKSLR